MEGAPVSEIDFTSWMERMVSEEEQPGAAGHDPVTGLLDGASFLRELEAALVDCRKADRRLAVLLMAPGGLRFEGHPPRDLIVRFADRLLERGTRLRAAARLAGNRFAALVQDAEEPDGTERLMAGLVARMEREGAGLKAAQVSVPLGAGMFPRDGDDEMELLDAAQRGLWLMDRLSADWLDGDLWEAASCA